jgi:hypothetical protein
MRGIEDFNFPAFDLAARNLREFGITVISPAEHDRECGIDAVSTPELTGEQLRAAILWDLEQVANCDGIYMLHGWENSKGARVEHALAIFLGKVICYD